MTDKKKTNKKRNAPKTVKISYPKEQKGLYQIGSEKCIYKQHERQVGINKGGLFLEMVAQKYYEGLGYNVFNYYYLVRNRKKRERMTGFKKICEVFGETQVRTLINKAEMKFAKNGKRICGGDPDLFVFKDDYSEAFFVEVKNADKDEQLNENQELLFPLLESYLSPVIIAQVYSE